MADKKSFVLYRDQQSVFDSMSDAEAGMVIKALFKYEAEETMPNFKGLLLTVFMQFKSTLDRDRIKWEKRAEAGSKGGKQKKANSSKDKQTVPSVSDSVSVSVSKIPSLESVIKYALEYAKDKNLPIDKCKDQAEAAYNYYSDLTRGVEVNFWIDSNGKPIKNWKHKLRQVWFSKIKITNTDRASNSFVC